MSGGNAPLVTLLTLYQIWNPSSYTNLYSLPVGDFYHVSPSAFSEGLTVGTLRATSHSSPRACDHHSSSTLIGGKGGAGPSLLHTMLERPTEYISECKMDVKSTWIPPWHQMDNVSWSLGLFSKTTSWR